MLNRPVNPGLLLLLASLAGVCANARMADADDYGICRGTAVADIYRYSDGSRIWGSLTGWGPAETHGYAECLDAAQFGAIWGCSLACLGSGESVDDTYCITSWANYWNDELQGTPVQQYHCGHVALFDLPEGIDPQLLHEGRLE
jgi:hypothetical protein